MSNATSPSLLIFGASGFIGGDITFAVLGELVERKNDAPWRSVGVVTSSPEKQKQIKEYVHKTFPSLEKGSVAVEVVKRSKENSKAYYEHVTQISARYDLAVQAATSDDIELTKAINKGLEQGKKETGKLGKLMHFSGVQLIESEPVGEFVETPIYDDSSSEQIASIPDSAAHRGIDVEIDQARQAGRVDATIICPALVWGEGRGPGSRVSQQVPDMTRKAILNGQPVVVGKGTNEWTNVNVNQMTDFVLALLRAQLSSDWAPSRSEPWSTFYFAVSPTFHTFHKIAENIGAALGSLQKSTGTTLLPISTTEVKHLPVPEWDRSQKGVRVEDDSRAGGEQAEIEARTPFWPNRTNNRAVAKRSLNLPGAPFFQMEFTDDKIKNDVQWIAKEWMRLGTVPEPASKAESK